MTKKGLTLISPRSAKLSTPAKPPFILPTFASTRFIPPQFSWTGKVFNILTHDGLGRVRRAKEQSRLHAVVATLSEVSQEWTHYLGFDLPQGFIITSFIEGVSLGDILCESGSRLIRKDVDRGDIEKIYRQVAQIHLKLSKLNFSRIGSPSKSSNSKNIAHICSRPLTWKAHEILSSQTASFSSTTDYFKYVADQDLQHLYKQSNSVDDENDARKKYAYWNAFKALVPCLVSAEHEKGPFKLICDDFGPANMIVDNAQNLNIVAVIDWEWTYTGPYQLFWSPPRWLLIQPPNSWEDSDERLSIYHRYLELYIRILGEEEVRVLGADIHPEERPSKMMRQFRANGWMWFHHIIWGGFNGPTHIPFKELQASTADFDRLVAEVPQEDIDDFVKTKIDHLDWIRKHCHYE